MPKTKIRIRKIKEKKKAPVQSDSNQAVTQPSENIAIAAIHEIGILEETHSSKKSSSVQDGEQPIRSEPTLLAMKNTIDRDVASFNKRSLKSIKLKWRNPMAATDGFNDINYATSIDKLRKRDHELRTKKLFQMRMKKVRLQAE